jgi:hypothetical protein
MRDVKYNYALGLQVVYGKDTIQATLFYKDGNGNIAEEKIPANGALEP